MSDINAITAGLLQDLASVQDSRHKTSAYAGAAEAVMALEQPLDEVVAPDGTLPKIAGIGPSSTRVIREVLRTGGSPTVEQAIDASGKRSDIERRRALRTHVLSRAAVVAVLSDRELGGPSRRTYRGDLQMHSEWSDGRPTVAELAAACVARGYHYAAVTDHSYGLKIARGMSMTDVAAQHREIDRVNARLDGAFRLIKGVEANINADGTLDLGPSELQRFELVLAAPHAALRTSDDQTARLLGAIATPGVHILAHPRGRKSGSRGGIVANWRKVFKAAASAGVAVEIDGDPSRQDLDYVLAAEALDVGCLFALDSDAHAIDELWYADMAMAHARLAGIPPDRIVNCWTRERLLKWLSLRSPTRPTPARRAGSSGRSSQR